MTVYAKEQVEAAICVWEEILKCLQHGDEGHPVNRYYMRHGMADLRSCAIDIGVWAEQVYVLVDEDVRDACAWDFEILPLIFRLIEWHDDGFAHPLPKNAAQEVSDKLKENRKMERVRGLEPLQTGGPVCVS